ncbi:asparaginase [Ornithinibacillus halotolerans]|uniref:L-asparaginase 2 n=1 Tax=Ornithinibacillus halotolerans TaxID=1274357 RepID=A0A916SD75_9BACI|nr:asparaginase [Ornithinibacillus halotolerans]GGA91315.1 L-asparaginase 2 [Ornithinibacillus halotolerans]
MKNILLITLGGTISAQGMNRLDLKDYTSGSIQGDFYLENIPEIKDIANIEVLPVDNVSSTQINGTHWIQLKKDIEYYLNEKEFDGVVITHGTNTLEETAYFLHLAVNTSKPIVLVGSQRPYTAISSDAQLNLIHAIRVAAHPDSHQKGVLVAFNNKIHSAREVTKVDTYDIDGFQSGVMGCLGYIDAAHEVVYYRNPLRKHTIYSDLSKIEINDLPKVEIVYSYAGASGEIIKTIVESNKYQGIVMAGTGAGRFSKLEEEALKIAVEKGMHVVRSSRVGNGRVIDIQPYDQLRAISADNLNPQKARILLALASLVYSDRESIQKLFYHY